MRRMRDSGFAATCFSPITLAFLGDSVWDLYARCRHLLPRTHVTEYRERAMQCVRAEHQARCLDDLERSGGLTPAERDIVRRGRNADVSVIPKRLRGSPEAKRIYQKATALECLVGYLYLTSPERLHGVMRRVGMVASRGPGVRLPRPGSEPPPWSDAPPQTPREEGAGEGIAPSSAAEPEAAVASEREWRGAAAHAKTAGRPARGFGASPPEEAPP